MTLEQHARIKDVFLKVIECLLEQRTELLVVSCGDDVELRREVQRLFDNHVQGTIYVADFLIPYLITATANRDDRATHIDGLAATAGAITFEQLAIGTVIAERYRVVQMLGEGGMGQVYRVEDLVLNQIVALKFLNPFMVGSLEWLDRFHKEAKLVCIIVHTNVCWVYDIGDWQGSPFILMEYVDGEDLATLLRRIGRVLGDKVVELVGQICAGLAAVHVHGVLHCDLKSANIMVDGQGQVRITDFGLAGLEGQIRGAEIRFGILVYMSLEQLRGSAVISRSDIYALGFVLYELFMGRCPFPNDF